MSKVFCIYIVVLLSFFSCRNKDLHINNEEVLAQNDSVTNRNVNVELLYGLPLNEYEIEKYRVRSNETLAKLLYKAGISANDVNTLTGLSEKIFDSRKIKAGNNCINFYKNSGENIPKHLIYEIDKFEYLHFSLLDSLYVDRIKKETDTITQFAAFSINNSLWLTIKEKNLDLMLALELSEIYAWSIDFFELQEGDSIRVTYDEILVDGKSVGIDKIHAAYFRHMNHDYYAVLFEQEGKQSYFDLEGNSLRKAFLKAPLRYNRISSRFSHNRLHPILKIRRPHHGVDYAASIGTPVQSIGDGIVVGVTYTQGAGRMVKIKHNSIYATAYLHLRSYGNGIMKGAHVVQGQVIGYVGSSGLSTGPHLDFRIYKNGNAIDPLKMESPPVEPVKSQNIPAFNEKIYLALKELRIEQTYLAITEKKGLKPF